MGLTARRLFGVVLLAGAYLPLHRLLDPARTGPAGEATRATAEAAWGVGVFGTIIAVGVAIVLVLVVPEAATRGRLGRLADGLSRPRPATFAAAVATVATLLCTGVALLLYRAVPFSVDEMAQLLNARALAAGMLALPLPGDPTAWTIQNGLLTPDGWASIYPPFHTLLLAAGLRVGAPWLVGPLAVGVGTWACALSFEALLGARTGRTAAIVLAACPFWLLLGATYLSHTTAAASLALVLWFGLRARSGRLGWAAAAGAATGAAVTARPWVGVVCAAVLLGTLWWSDRGRIVARIGALVAGGAPFAILLFWWNARLFGSPLRLGYSAAFGPAHAVGFHIDPWGNLYTPREAVAYTGADLVQLGAHLLETPLPAVALVGAALVAGMRRAGDRAFLVWAGAAVVANVLYWHHGIHMGPRMLYESVPAWIALVVASAIHLTTAGGLGSRVRRAGGWAVLASVLGAPVLTASAVRSTTPPTDPGLDAALTTLATEAPALVFLHGSWSSRVVARLTAAGMRRDSVETAVRRNDICAVDRYARWRGASPPEASAAPPDLDLDPLPGSPRALARVRLAVGDEVWADPRTPWDEQCLREATADALGTIDIEPFLWAAPPLPGVSVVAARDMGPATNERVRSAIGDRSAWVYAPGEDGGEGLLMPYVEGMARLWGLGPS